MGPFKALEESARCTQAGLEESQHLCCELHGATWCGLEEWPVVAKISPQLTAHKGNLSPTSAWK